MINIKLETLVFKSLANINKYTNRRFVTMKQILFYIDLLNKELKSSNIRINYEANIKKFQFKYSEIIHTYTFGPDNYIFFMLPWIESSDLILASSGPVLSDIIKAMEKEEIIKQVISMDKKEIEEIKRLQKRMEEYHIIELKNNISNYYDKIEIEQKKIEKYRQIKLREKRKFDY